MKLKITSFGSSAEGIRLMGDPKKPEPDHVRIAFPGGDVEVVRVTNGENPDYWVHVRVSKPQSPNDDPEDDHAEIVDARLDIHSKGTTEADRGDFAHPDLYHVALRVRKIQPNATRA